jgi:protein-L-isoaspartate(D-aspartate) O-methyltransferase
MNLELARFNMIEQQIRTWNVLDPAVLSLLAVVRREEFVPAAYRALAFVDCEVPLPEGQCMLAPKVEARLLQEAGVQRHERVLEVGAGSGFMAALLAHRARSVLTVELHASLAKMAAANLQRAGVANCKTRVVDGARGLPEEGLFDVIMLSGSVNAAPQALLQQLAPGGRLVAVIGDEPMMRAVRVQRLSESRFETRDLFDTVAPRLRGFDEPSRFHF